MHNLAAECWNSGYLHTVDQNNGDLHATHKPMREDGGNWKPYLQGVPFKECVRGVQSCHENSKLNNKYYR